MPLVLGFLMNADAPDGRVVLVGATSGRTRIDRTKVPGEAMVFTIPLDALIWLEDLDGKLTERMRAPGMPRLELYADHDLSIGPMGWIELEPIAERKDKTWLVTAHYHPISAPVAIEEAA